MKGKVERYETHDNGGRPFLVEVSPKLVEAFLLGQQRLVLHLEDYKRVFIGDHPSGPYPGNTLLVQTSDNKYTYVGESIYVFRVEDGDQIVEYHSPVGNSDVPYPYAIGKVNTYFMLDREWISNKSLNLKKDGYDQFYSHKQSVKRPFKEANTIHTRM
eukprot:TRINITY_DN7950_c0_g1_i1.p1 TRINITY_DN7950_c0_g1~~TRINITY_DN7950_c0_g1_i1.p1  ORF type:complete len:158 (+),score=13.89 TRINITY_DN7950_c0_g1_i1:74-547(+)